MDARVIKVLVNVAAVFLAGAGAGAVGGFVLGKKKGAAKAWQDADQEMEAMEDRLKRLYKIEKYEAPFDFDSNRSSFDIGVGEYTEADVVSTEMLYQLKEYVDAQEYATHSEPTGDEEIVNQGSLFEKFKNEDESSVTVVLDMMPYVISEAEFTHDMEDYAKIELSYYQMDGVVADEMDRVVDDVDPTIGVNNLAAFADEDCTVVYVRNNRLKADFLLALDIGSYRETVLGEDQGPIMERRGRKSRSTED